MSQKDFVCGCRGSGIKIVSKPQTTSSALLRVFGSWITTGSQDLSVFKEIYGDTFLLLNCLKSIESIDTVSVLLYYACNTVKVDK